MPRTTSYLEMIDTFVCMPVMFPYLLAGEFTHPIIPRGADVSSFKDKIVISDQLQEPTS